MKKIHTILFVFSLMTCVISTAQEHDPRLFSPSSNQEDTTDVVKIRDTVSRKQFNLDYSKKDGIVNVKSDTRIETLTEFLSTPQTGQNTVKLAGYRLQIYYDQEKNNVNQKKADFIAKYKDLPAYINYKAPNFRLRIGDFRTRLQAEYYMHEIMNDWPDAIIVEDDIELPTLSEKP